MWRNEVTKSDEDEVQFSSCKCCKLLRYTLFASTKTQYIKTFKNDNFSD